MDKDTIYPIINDITSKVVYVASINTDLTEGRGHKKVLCVCDLKTTAIRKGAGKNVQGSPAYIDKCFAYIINGATYIPGEIVKPTKQELDVLKEAKIKEEILEKAKKLGMSEEDISILKGE